MNYYAHSVPGQPVLSWQDLQSHLTNVAETASRFASAFQAEPWAYAAGLLHDIGKYSLQFQAYLLHENGLDDPIITPSYRGRIPHAAFGAAKADELAQGFAIRAVGILLAYCIAGHHRGLPDHGNENTPGPCLWKYLHSPNTLDVPFLPDELAGIEWPSGLPIRNAAPNSVGFQIAFFARMLFSCLVDADFLDTEQFYSVDKSEKRGSYPSIHELLNIFSRRINLLAERAEPTPVNQCRSEVLAQCISSSQCEPGLFSLTVPTGGGKTLSSLAFALHHAPKHGLKRVIYAIPFTSIIEQNAKVFREVLGSESVVEHHCNIDCNRNMEDETSLAGRLASENWDAPVIATTNVQLFDSLFSNRPSKVRKLHNLAESVIILDEAQAIPIERMAPCLAALRELVSNYRVTVVLCTATQPAIEHRPDFNIGLEHVREIVPDPAGLFSRLRRVDIRVEPEIVPDDVLAKRVASDPQALVIVNTRKHARVLFDLISDATVDEGNFHLSTLMCPVHRSQALNDIRTRLENGQPCRVISTQLIEAGVDVDFPKVYRSIAGLDSIAQAAGRCNREGKLERGEVTVFSSEQAPPQGSLRHASQSAKEVIPEHRDDLLSPEAIQSYFEMHYWTQSEHMDALDILNLCKKGGSNGQFPFEEMARFSLIEDTQHGVIIPYDDAARSMIEQVRAGNAGHRVYRRLQRYAVGVYQNEFARLVRSRSVEAITEDMNVLKDMHYYSADTGLGTEPWEPMTSITV
jgi:CRISPR-associated endonuclease/helicase Cas3